MGVVGQNTISTFTSPVNGTAPIDANTVKGNDNTIKTAFNLHDSDGTIHFQDSVAASRPAAGTAGRKWIDTDTLRVYYDNGSIWQEIAYATLSGGSFTGPILLANGTVSLPSLAFVNDPDCGLYRIAANNIGFAANGAKVLDLSTTGLGVTGTLGVTGAATVAGTANFAANVILTADGAEVATTTAGVTTTRLKTDATGGLLSVDGNNPLRLSTNSVDRLTISGGGVATFSGPVNTTQLQISTAISRIIPGATSLLIRNNADSTTNLSITDAGAVTVPGTLGVTGLSTLATARVTGHSAYLGAVVNADIGLYASGGIAGSGVQQYGMYIDTSGSSSGTTLAAAIAARSGTAAAAYTASNIYGVNIQNAVKGAGSTITQQFGLYIDALTSGNTNYAIYTSAGLVRFGGAVTCTAVVTTAASATGSAGLNLPHGAAPTSPVDGDVWTTTAGMFVRVNGVTVGPLS